MASIWEEEDASILGPKPVMDKWDGYGPAYDHHLRKFVERGAEIRLLEIGVQSGGSISVWKRYFSLGPFLYVGVDINGICKQLERPEANIFIEKADQTDIEAMILVCAKYGPFDIIIDDGGHQTSHMVQSLRLLLPHCLVDKGVYVIEDIHANYLDYSTEEEIVYESKNMGLHIAAIFDAMHRYWSPTKTRISTDNQRQLDVTEILGVMTRSISLYDSMAFFEKQTTQTVLQKVLRGSLRIPYFEGIARLTAFDPTTKKEAVRDVFVGKNSVDTNNRSTGHLDNLIREAEMVCGQFGEKDNIAECSSMLAQKALNFVYYGH